MTDLSNIILETIASLNEINPLTGRLIQIARDGKISDDEMKDFAYISKKLDEISLAIDSLNLWVDKTAGEQGLNLELDRVGDGFCRRPLTPPDMRFRIRRFS